MLLLVISLGTYLILLNLPLARVSEDDDDTQILLQRSSTLCLRQSWPSHRNRKRFFGPFPFNTILNLLVLGLIVFLVSVQHVLLHDLSCKMARLFSCCWRSWKSNNGLQWVFAFAFSLTWITLCNSYLGWFHFQNEKSRKIEARK